MKHVLLTAVAGTLVALSGAALAADMSFSAPPPRAAAPVWTGFYLGANGGWGWSSFDTTISPVGTASISDFPTQFLSPGANGAVFGGHVGYNWQTASWVLGIEGDFDGAGISGTQQIINSKRSPSRRHRWVLNNR